MVIAFTLQTSIPHLLYTLPVARPPPPLSNPSDRICSSNCWCTRNLANGALSSLTSWSPPRPAEGSKKSYSEMLRVAWQLEEVTLAWSPIALIGMWSFAGFVLTIVATRCHGYGVGNIIRNMKRPESLPKPTVFNRLRYLLPNSLVKLTLYMLH